MSDDRKLNQVDWQSHGDKKAFIVKVYRIFIYSLLYSALSSYAGVRLGITFSWWWIVLDIVVFLVCFLARNSLFLLYLWTTISGFTSAPILSRMINGGQLGIIWQAILATALLFAVLSIYVHFTKENFSHWKAILFALLTLLLLSIFPLAIFPNMTGEIVWSVVSIFLFSCYVLYDTSEIIHRYRHGDEIMAALDLHLDFVNLFWDFVRLFKSTSHDSEAATDSTVDTGTDVTDLMD